MSCERFREAIASHAAGANIGGAAAAHLAACESCQSELERQRLLLDDVDAELSGLRAVTASPQFVSRVMSHAPATHASSIAWRPAVAWIGLAAAAAIAVASLRAPAPAVAPAPRESAAVAPAPPAHPAVAETRAAARTDPRPAVRQSQPRLSRQMAAARPMPEPPVIVDPDQARAIARLRELLSEGRLTAKMLPPAAPHEPAELTVTPLEIPEIIVPDVEAVARERQ